MKTISLQDQHFSHSANGYSCDFHPGKKIQWSRSYPYISRTTVFTGNSLHMVNIQPNKFNVAWLIEPYEICPYTYQHVLENRKWFDLILTHDSEVMLAAGNSAFMPYGDCWIRECDWKIYDKSKLCSIFCSEKKLTPQHILRHECLTLDGIDHFGYMNRVAYKLDGLKDYKFSVVVENSNRDDFFTEKIMDCFATGTIPIYCGTKNIGRYFSEDGIIQFSTIDQLRSIISKIKSGEIVYETFLPAIQSNFLTFRSFVRKDDRVLEILEEKGLI